MLQINTWKFLLSGGLLGLLLSSAILVIVIYRLSPMLQSRRKLSLRDQHTNPVPHYGGIALFWGFIGALSVVWWFPFLQQGLGLQFLPVSKLAGFCIGGLMAWGLGFTDDIFRLRARWKLAGQIGIALVMIKFEFNIHTVQIPFFQVLHLGFLSWPLTILWIVGVMNAINLIDGLDGLASGLSIVALTILSIICWWQGQLSLMLLIMIVGGATLGFLSFNRPPASIFMGDSGSMFLGFTLAILSLWVMGSSPSGQSMLPLLIMAVPILDTTFSAFRRLLKGIPFYSADNDHLHHRLISKGYSPTQAMVLLIAVSVIFSGLAIIAYRMSHHQGFVFLGGVILSYLLLYWLEYDVIRTPFISILGQGDSKRHRVLMIALGDQVNVFFAKDPDQKSLIRSFHFWTEMAGVSHIELRHKDSVVWQSGPENQLHRMIMFRQRAWEVRMALPESSWKIDSDVKGNLLEKVSMAFLVRLEQLEVPSVIHINKSS
jgi:UDP-GlcNAc:undecaprenyl-phosphate/decaprenyl-phosphate GlcNAc-1-phosphate transferase